MQRLRVGVLIIHFLMLAFTMAVQAEEITVEVNDGIEIPVSVYPASGEYLLLMLPSEHGYFQGHHQLAATISEKNTEVWLADLFAAYFSPVSSDGMASFSAKDVSILIDEAGRRTGKKVFLMTNDKGAEILLEATRHWQQHATQEGALAGAILVSPYLYTSTPVAGKEVSYLPIATITNFNLFIMQPKLSPKFWRFPQLIDKLEQGGSDVYTQKLDRVRDRFFFRPDATEEEQSVASKLPVLVHRAIRLTGKLGGNRQIVEHIKQPVEAGHTKAAKRGLQPYAGDFTPGPFSLKGMDGRSYTLEDFQGRVILLNFWATWCPPCVHEMPSMQALQDQFPDSDFHVVAINMAEEPSGIEEFLQKMDVDFTILLDSDGRVLRDWKVFAFPTSYILGRDGEIVYAGFGAIEWTEEAIVRQISNLIK
jgi:thiol-disulfide isomerase/thioredoxin